MTGSTEEEATTALEQAGFKVQTREREDPTQVGLVVDQDPDPGTARSSGATVTIFVGTDATAPADADADADARRREGRRPRRRALIRARRLALLRRGRARGHRGRGPRGAAGDDRARRRRGCTTARTLALAPGRRAARRRRRVRGPARAVRRGRDASRGCWSCWTCPTSARACSPPRCAWTRWSSRRCWPPPASRRCPTRACGSRAGAPSPTPSGASWPCSARPSSSSPRGWAPRSGSRRCASEAELAPALDAAFAHDSLVIVEGFSPGMEVECSVLGNGEPEASVPGEIVLKGADWYDYEAKYTPGGMELVVPARLDDDGARGRAAAGRGHVPARRLRRPGARGLLRRGRLARARQRAQHAARASRRRACTRSCGRPRAWRSRSCATGCWRSRVERFEAERPRGQRFYCP